MMNALSRRALLSALLALVGVVAVRSRTNGTARTRVVEDVFRWLGPNAALIGQRYLHLHSAEANLDVLADLLLARLQSTTGSDLRRDLSLAVQEDFARDDVVHLDGWVLSRTEVRLCALASLQVYERLQRETGEGDAPRSAHR